MENVLLRCKLSLARSFIALAMVVKRGLRDLLVK